MPKPWKAAVIGCGAIAQAKHLPGYRDCPGTTLVAGCDPEPARHAEARQFNPELRVYKDYRQMLAADQFDMISVCSPNKFHAEQTVAALEHGAHVLLEKPVTMSMAEYKAVARTVKKTGKQVIVAFSHRFMRGNRTVHKLLDKGAIGRPYMIRMRFAHGGPYPGWARDDWFYKPKLAGGGALLDMGIHAIDQCLWHLGPIKRVQALSRTLRKKIAVDDNAVLLLEFADGAALGYIEVGWTSPAGFNGLEIMGDAGCIVEDYRQGLFLTTGKSSPNLKKRLSLKTRLIDKVPTTGGWPREVPEAYQAFRRGGDMGIGIDVGGAALAVALAAYESSRTGRAVDVAAVK